MPGTRGRGQPLVQRYAALLERRALPVVAVLLGLTVVLGVLASRLELRTDFTDLLPGSAPSVQALDRINERLGGVGTLVVGIETEDKEAGKRFVDDLVRAVRQRMAGDIRSIDYTATPVRSFFQRSGALFLSVAELEELDRVLADAIREQRLKNNPFYVELDDDPGQSASDRARALADDLRKRGGVAERFPEGYYLGEEGKLLGVFMRPRASALEIGAARRLVERMQQVIDELQPRRYHPSLRVQLTGTVQTSLEEYASIVRDIVSTAGLCVVLVGLVVWFYFRLLSVLLLLMVTLAAGAIWAFGIGYLGFGHVNAQTAFLGSIIVGTGINYGIILVARYQEERRTLGSSEALPRALALTARPTLVAAATTALAFGTLSFAQMRSYAQFGIIGGLGMAICWVLSYTLLPAMLTLLERLPRLRSNMVPRPGQLRISYPGWLARLPIRWALPILGISGILVAWSTAETVAFLPHALESDIGEMRRRGSERSPSVIIDNRLGRVMGGETLTPAVVLADSPEEAGQVCTAMDELRKRNPKNPVVAWCRSVGTFVPDRQPEKLRVIASIRHRLESTPRNLLPGELRSRLDELRARLPREPVELGDVPEEIRSRFRERSGAETVALVAPGDKRSLWNLDALFAFSEAIGNIRLPGGKVLHSSGESVVFADLVRTIAEDAPRTTALAVACVLLVLGLTIRRGRPIALVGASLAAGVGVMVGLAALFRVKYNFFNFVALPTTLGIGIDYPVNVQQRYDQEGPGRLEEALRGTGAAVLVASLTTIIGYAVLLISDSLALASFGKLAILGELTCLAAALLLLPAMIATLERRRLLVGEEQRERRVTGAS